MKTSDIEIKLFSYINVRSNLVVLKPNGGIYLMEGNLNKELHECDVLAVSSAGYATEYEIKISVADLKKDKLKKHGHDHNLIKNLYFVVPEKMEEIALEEIPKRAGLLIVIDRRGKLFIKEVKPVEKNKKAVKWSLKQEYQLARLGAIRVKYLLAENDSLKEELQKQMITEVSSGNHKN